MNTEIKITFQDKAETVEFTAEVMVRPSQLRHYLSVSLLQNAPFLMSVYPTAAVEQLALPFPTRKI